MNKKKIRLILAVILFPTSCILDENTEASNDFSGYIEPLRNEIDDLKNNKGHQIIELYSKESDKYPKKDDLKKLKDEFENYKSKISEKDANPKSNELSEEEKKYIEGALKSIADLKEELENKNADEISNAKEDLFRELDEKEKKINLMIEDLKKKNESSKNSEYNNIENQIKKLFEIEKKGLNDKFETLRKLLEESNNKIYEPFIKMLEKMQDEIAKLNKQYILILNSKDDPIPETNNKELSDLKTLIEELKKQYEKALEDIKKQIEENKKSDAENEKKFNDWLTGKNAELINKVNKLETNYNSILDENKKNQEKMNAFFALSHFVKSINGFVDSNEFAVKNDSKNNLKKIISDLNFFVIQYIYDDSRNLEDYIKKMMNINTLYPSFNDKKAKKDDLNINFKSLKLTGDTMKNCNAFREHFNKSVETIFHTTNPLNLEKLFNTLVVSDEIQKA